MYSALRLSRLVLAQTESGACLSLQVVVRSIIGIRHRSNLPGI